MLSIDRVTTNQSFVIMRRRFTLGGVNVAAGAQWRLGKRPPDGPTNPGLQSAPVYPSDPEGFHPPYFNYTMNYTNP